MWRSMKSMARPIEPPTDVYLAPSCFVKACVRGDTGAALVVVIELLFTALGPVVAFTPICKLLLLLTSILIPDLVGEDVAPAAVLLPRPILGCAFVPTLP